MTPAPVYRGLLVPNRIFGLTPLGFMIVLAAALQLIFATGQVLAVLAILLFGLAIMALAGRDTVDPLEALRAALRHRRDYRI